MRSTCIPPSAEETNLGIAVVLRLLELMHEALSSGVVLSKRCELFNRDSTVSTSLTLTEICTIATQPFSEVRRTLTALWTT